MDEQQQPHGSVGRQVELVERLQLSPLLHVGVGQVEEAGADVLLHLLDGLLEDRRGDEAEHQGLRRALHEVAEDALGAPVPGRPAWACAGGVGRGCTAISNRAVRGSASSDLVRSAGFTGRCQE